jgi:hypothetical protein
MGVAGGVGCDRGMAGGVRRGGDDRREGDDGTPMTAARWQILVA